MKLKDSIYGEMQVEPVFEQLINTKEVQRLKKIHQGGASYLVNPKWNVTRYEHSVGTMMLIRLMGGSIEEQIAGLLHDISHTAFSHVVDFALDNKEEDYHEQIYHKIVEQSNIPHLLRENGYDDKDILFNEKKWTILEQSAPKLCADRVDYTLRDMYHYGFISEQEIKKFLNHLTVINGEMTLTSIKVAEWFVQVYYKEVIDFFMHPLNIYAYHQLSQAIKITLQSGEIKLEDLAQDDDYVLNLLKQSKSEEVIQLVESMNEAIQLIESSQDYDIYQKKKLRIIDPTLLIEGVLFKTADKSILARSLTEQAVKKSKEGVFLKIKRIPE